MDLLERDLSNVKLSVSHKTLNDMHPADITDIIEKLDPGLMGVKELEAIRQLLGYRENNVGRIMTSEFVAVSEDGTVADAVESLRAVDEGFESVRYVYLVDDDEKLLGTAYLVMYALSSVMQSMIPAFPRGSTWMSGSAAATILLGFSTAAVCVLLTFATAPLYLSYLRRRDDAGEDSNGAFPRGTAIMFAL